MKGNRVAVITPTGGHAVICADACDRLGLDLPAFPDQLVKDVEKHVRAGVIKLQNPMDLGDMFDFEMYATIVLRLLQEPSIDALMLSFIFLDNIPGGTVGNIFPMMKKLMSDFQKPIALCVAGNPNDINRMRSTTDFPIFESPEQAIHALSLLRNHYAFVEHRRDEPELPAVDRDAVHTVLDRAIEESRLELTHEAVEILNLCGIPVARDILAPTADDAVAAAAELGFPVALKIASPDILHKTEAGGVALNIEDADGVRAAFNSVIASAGARVPGARIQGVTVQKMISGAREFLVGVNYNEQFGHAIVFGLGGIFVEAFQDISMRLAPLSRFDAECMLDEIKSAKVLGAFRGMEPADRETLIGILLKLSALVTACPRIRELDINPLLIPADGQSITAADARMIISKQ